MINKRSFHLFQVETFYKGRKQLHADLRSELEVLQVMNPGDAQNQRLADRLADMIDNSESGRVEGAVFQIKKTDDLSFRVALGKKSPTALAIAGGDGRGGFILAEIYGLRLRQATGNTGWLSARIPSCCEFWQVWRNRKAWMKGKGWEVVKTEEGYQADISKEALKREEGIDVP